MSLSPKLLALGAAALVGLGCGPRDNDDAEIDLVIEGVTGSLGSVLLLAQLSEIVFEVDPVLATTPVQDAPPIAIGDVVNQIGTLASLLGCPEDPQIATDDMTFVEVTIDCQSEAFAAGLSGTLVLQPSFDSEPCGNDDCVTAVNWRLTSAGDQSFRYVAANVDVEFVSPADLRFPVGDGERSLRSDRVDINGASRSIAEVDARWTAQPCITMDLEMILNKPPTDSDPVLDEAYPIAFAADGVRVCLGRCPEAGDVNISYAFGAILEWQYGTGSTVRVVGPRGRSRDVELACQI